MIDVEETVRRLDKREGFTIVSYREVGLPVFRLNSAITVQEISPLGAIEEFTLRAISLAVDTVSDLVNFLGLPERVVEKQVGQLCYDGLVAHGGPDLPRYSLTPPGRRRLQDATSAVISRQRIPLYVDGITRKLVSVQTKDLFSSEQLDPTGESLVSPTRRNLPKAEDIDLAAVNRIVANSSVVDGPKRRAIRLDAIVGRVNLVFQRGIALAFKSADGRRVSIAFAIDGRLSEDHEIEYARSGAGLRSPIFSALFDADRRRRDVQVVARELRSDVVVPESESENPQQAVRAVLSLGAAKPALVARASVRMLTVYEHAPLLRSALESAKQRVLIVSPWIRASVVDDRFFRLLSSCLGRGVEVTIGFGIARKDPDERPRDRLARNSLEALMNAFPNFKLVKKGNTHAKVLLVDSSYFVVTSFNWLSFCGDPKRPMREEEGTMVEDEIAVNSYFEKTMSRMITLPTGPTQRDV